MSKSDHHEQNATDSPEETTNNCPICSTPIQGIGCAGPAAQTVEPCGCDLTAIDATVDDVIPGADQATETIVDSVDGDGDLSLLSRGSIDAWLSSDTTVEDVEVPER